MRKTFLWALACVAVAAIAAPCLAGSYQAVTGIPYTGATTDRGIAVNKNPGPYYGYFYGLDSASGAVRIWKPNSGGTMATAYSNTGNKLSWASAPAGSLFMNLFVGEDNTVWVVDYGGKTIATGPADGSVAGGNLTAQFNTSAGARSIFVKGALGQAGTRVYVVINAGTAKTCEVWEYSGTAWSRIQDLTALGMANPYYVTVDSAGNSYWAASAKVAPFVVKVKPDFTTDATWTFTKPAFMSANWTVEGIAYVNDPLDTANQDYLYVSAYNQTSCCRFDMNGSFLDGYGSTFGLPAGSWPSTYTVIALSAPSVGNKNVWLTVDDQRNTYLSVIYPSTEQAYKVHLQNAPQPPPDASGGNDVYGQIRLSWTPPAPSMDNPTGYNIYRGSASGTETLYATTDSYPKWKDSVQGNTAGGPLYYRVTSYNGAGESAPSAEVGPLSVVASTAPAPGSKGVALSYSEVNAADTVNNPNYDRDWAAAPNFLTARGVAWDKMWDADAANLNIQNDDAAGYRLLILEINRDMSSYAAQCIKDYVKYSQGKVLSTYYNSIASSTGTRLSNYQLADVYRANALNVGQGGSPFDSDATRTKYRLLKFIPLASEAAALFAGLQGGIDPFDGAQDYGSITYLIGAYSDGTASEVGKWYNKDGVTQSQADPNDVSLVVGYRDASKAHVQSVMLGCNWWAQSTAYARAGGSPGSFSADRLLENILGFLGVSTTPLTTSAETIGSAKQKPDGNGVVLVGKVVTRELIPGSPGTVYIQEPNWSSGIRMVNGPLVTEGQLVTVTGVIQTATSVGDPTVKEREISVIELLPAGSGTVPPPAYLATRDAGGGTQGPQFGVEGGKGQNNVGLLVTVVGAVTESGVSGSAFFFRLDDGAKVMLGSQTLPGVKVYGFAPLGATIVSATGVVGTELDGTTVIPVIRLRDSEAGIPLAP